MKLNTALQNKPLVTIITPSFNQGEFLEQTILSVINQSYDNIQYILVDGGSVDNSHQIINEYFNRIDLVIIEKDKGQSDAINKGFRHAKGDLVGWINSDDILNPKSVERIVDLYLKNKDGVIFYNCNNQLIDINSKLIKNYQIKISSKDTLVFKNYSIIQQGSFYKTTTVRNIGLLNETLNYCMDLDLWIRLLKFGNIYYLEDLNSNGFRIYPTTKTSTGGEFFFKEILKTLKLNGATIINSAALRQGYWYLLKAIIKRKINK